jgi:2-iminobutanoate/2-iminopropanoate deaminase
MPVYSKEAGPVKKIITTDKAPAAIGPYSQAVKIRTREMLFCSGQIPIDPATGEIVSGNAAAQARQALENLNQVIAAAGFALNDIVKTTIYLTDLASFSEVNEVYASLFSGDFPARATIQVAALPRGAAVEIEAFLAR